MKRKITKQEKLEEEKYEQELERLEEKSQDYVLPISAKDYVEGVGRNLTDYNFKSVSAMKGYERKRLEGNAIDGIYIIESALARIVKKGEEIGAEVIVDVRPSHYAEYSSSKLYLIGTALIPKEKK